MSTSEDEIARLLDLLADKDRLLAIREHELGKKKVALSKATTLATTLAEKVRKLEFELELLRKQLFGKSSEKLDPGQLELAFAEAVGEAAAAGACAGEPPLGDEALPSELLELLAKLKAEEEAQKEEAKKGGAGPKRRPRKASRFPQDLEVERGPEIHPPAEELRCDCGCEPVRMGEEVSRRLAHRPAAFFWKEQVRVKYVCPGCDKITRPVLPPAPIEKSLADTSLLADLLLSKYCDHLPLSRLEDIYSRGGVELSKSTLGSWIGAVTDDALLGAIAEAVGNNVTSRSLAQTDETGILVLDRLHPEGRFKGRMWVFCGKTGELFYEYTPTKETKYPQARLADFSGTLQADAYPGFDALFRDGSILEGGCNAHARRKFKDAHDAEPTRDEPQWALLFYSRIFKIEREAKEKGFDAEARLALRQEKSAPLVRAFYSWLKRLKERLIPSDPLRRAVVYALNQEGALSLFLKDGRLEIHNNRSELSLRQVAVGRKNWLFAGSPAGAKSAAVAYTLIMSCKELGLPVREYLIDVLDRVSTHPMSRIDELTPRGWKAAREAANQPPE
jgi:transposase